MRSSAKGWVLRLRFVSRYAGNQSCRWAQGSACFLFPFSLPLAPNFFFCPLTRYHCILLDSRRRKGSERHQYGSQDSCWGVNVLKIEVVKPVMLLTCRVAVATTTATSAPVKGRTVVYSGIFWVVRVGNRHGDAAIFTGRWMCSSKISKGYHINPLAELGERIEWLIETFLISLSRAVSSIFIYGDTTLCSTRIARHLHGP